MSLYWVLHRLRLWLALRLIPRRYPETADEWFACYPSHRKYAREIKDEMNLRFPGRPTKMYVMHSLGDVSWDRHLEICVDIPYDDEENEMFEHFLYGWFHAYETQHDLDNLIEVASDWDAEAMLQ